MSRKGSDQSADHPEEKPVPQSTPFHGMIMHTPATRWQDASPTGNGAIGAMLCGRICRDQILLNHEALYYPRARPELMDLSDQVPELRRLIDAGQYREAQELLPGVHAERGGPGEGSTSDFTDPYQPFCDVLIGAATNGPFRHYRRGVDFASGRVWTEWEDDSGHHLRELFVSRATDTVWLRLHSSGPGGLSCRLAVNRDSAQPDDRREWASSGALEPPTCSCQAVGNTLEFQGRFPGGYAFGAVAQLTLTGGAASIQGPELVIEQADEALLRVRLFVDKEPTAALSQLHAELQAESAGFAATQAQAHAQLEAETQEFAAALAAHEALHRPLFERLRVELDDATAVAEEADTETPVQQRGNEALLLHAYEDAPSTRLVQTQYEFGRYLLICSSGTVGWPANLQGIWNGDAAPAWNSDFHLDENVQMNYWQALPGSLAELALPLFHYLERFLDDYRANARKLYGCRGIYVPIAQTTHGVALPMVWTNWISAAGWLAQHFYDYYLFTGDQTFLRDRAIPWMREVALFYEDYLTPDAAGQLQFIPSMSPENVPSGTDMGLITINATMDVAVCRELLTNLCAGCQVLGMYADSVPHWQEMLHRLPAYEANADGALREWLHPRFADNYHHRHQSHLYPLFPGIAVTAETDLELFGACRTAVEKRLVVGLASQSGWSVAHMANIYARLGDGDRALQCLEILARGSTGPNLFTYHNDWRDMGLSLSGWGRTPPFQIDANLGLSAAVLEMLAFSRPGWIKLLPALPGRWRKGSVAGLAGRGQITVDLSWDRDSGELTAQLTSQVDQQVRVVLPPGAVLAEEPLEMDRTASGGDQPAGTAAAGAGSAGSSAGTGAAGANLAGRGADAGESRPDSKLALAVAIPLNLRADTPAQIRASWGR
jgi:alpha-L-fucosidase 2